MTQDQNEPHSIWLCPSDETSEKLHPVIAQIAQAQNASTFDPHLTFLGDLNGPIATTFQACQSGFSRFASIRGYVGQLDRSEAFFMALYLNITLPDALTSLRQSMGKTLTGAPPKSFTPHVSLAYGALPKHFDDTTHQKLASTLSEGSITFDQVAIVRSAQSIPINQWTIAAKIDLTG